MIPKYLYHYTDITSLEYIYNDKTIKFQRLDLLNDPFEGIVINKEGMSFDTARKSIYCSCWTSESKESIAMWGIYRGFRGIRIKMLSTMFSKNIMLREIEDGFIPYGMLSRPIETKHRGSMDGRVITIDKVYGPYSLQYVQDVDETFSGAVAELRDTSLQLSHGYKDIKLLELGNKKIDYWNYEQEWRFKITPFSDMLVDLNADKTEDLNANEEYFLVPYSGEILEIMLAPCVEDDTINRIKQLLGNKYNDLVRRSEIKMQKK